MAIENLFLNFFRKNFVGYRVKWQLTDAHKQTQTEKLHSTGPTTAIHPDLDPIDYRLF